MCDRYPTEPCRRHFGHALVPQECDQKIHHLHAHARVAVRKIIDRGRNDRPHFGSLQRRADADGGAHHDVARQLALPGWSDDDIAQRTDAGVHAVGANVPLRRSIATRRRAVADAPLCGGRQATAGAFGDCADLAPAKGAVEQDVAGACTGARYGRSRAGRHCSSGARSRSRATPTSREPRTAPGLLNTIPTQANPNSSRTSMATCSARDSTK